MKFKDKTRGGYPVRILATDLPGDLPIQVWANDGTTNGYSYRCMRNGARDDDSFNQSPYDLIPDIPQQRKVVRWVDLRFPELFGYATEEEVRQMPGDYGIHPVKATLEWTED